MDIELGGIELVCMFSHLRLDLGLGPWLCPTPLEWKDREPVERHRFFSNSTRLGSFKLGEALIFLKLLNWGLA